MGARAVFKVYFLLCFLFIFSYHHVRGAEYEYVSVKNKETMHLLVKAMWEMVQSSFSLMEGVEALRQKHVNKPSFEVGYLMFTIFEKYRKMVDKYSTAIFMDKQLFKMELVMYLEEIENHHWEVEHLAAIQSPKLENVLNDTIYQELSWASKLLLLKDVMNSDGTAITSVTTPMPLPSEPDLGFAPEPVPVRSVPPIEALVKRRQDEEPLVTKVMNDDDNSMRLKLFRLMYETIKDSDVKCKRAELIRSHYENSSSFEIGYLMGDVMDKYNIMSDISMTLNRLFHEWKPIEHINAYEQISNQAIEINHMIDMMKGIFRKGRKEEKPADKGFIERAQPYQPYGIFGGVNIKKN